MDLPVSTAADILWAKICEKVRKSVVFIDDESAESLHWAGGLERLLCAGAVDVKHFSSFESGTPEQKKAVFITSSLLFDVTACIIKDVLEASSFQYVIVITDISSAIHLWKKTGNLEGDDREVFFQFEEKLLEWMGNMNYTAEVHHLSHSIAAITPQLFVTPPLSCMFPFLANEYKKIEHVQNVIKAMKPKADKKTVESLADIDVTMLPEKFAEQVKALVCSMNGLMDALKVADECYSIGHTSRIVASELAAYPPARNRRKTTTQRASVIFVDRTLDVASICGNHGDTLADRMLNLLPRLPGHHNDVMVDMTSLSHLHESARQDILVSGCLAHAPDDKASSLLSLMFTHSQKESTTGLHEELIHCARKEKMKVNDEKPVQGRVTADRVKGHVGLFRSHPASIRKHSGLLQLAQATVQTLGHSGCKSLDAMQGLEKTLLLCEDDESTIGEQLIQIIRRTGPGKPHQVVIGNVLSAVLQARAAFRHRGVVHRISCPNNSLCSLFRQDFFYQILWKIPDHLFREFTVDQFLALLVYVYSAYGNDIYDSAQKERELQQKLQKCLLMHKENDLSSTVKAIFGENLTKDGVKSCLGHVFGTLNAVGQARHHLRRYKSLTVASSSGLPSLLELLLKQILTTIFDPSKPELVDVEYRSGGLRDYLKTGFSLFMNVSKPRPSDCPIIILYVIGGVACSEVKLVHEMALKADCRIILGGSRLLNRVDTLNALFVQDRVK